MLFGVRVKVDPMRKSVSMNNLSEYEQPQESSNVAATAADVATGYASADEAVHNHSSGNRERKRGQIYGHYSLYQLDNDLFCVFSE